MSNNAIRVHRRTKIVATVGPGCDSEDMIGRLIAAGVDVFRLNFSHGAVRHHQLIAERIRRQARHQDRYVGILADLQGPKIRIASFETGYVSLTAGDSFRLSLKVDGEKGSSSAVGIEYRDLPKSVEVDDVLLLDDGKMQLRVDSVSDSDIDCTVLIGGTLSSRKGVNKLGGGIAAPALTEKDKADIRAMESIKPDFVAVSFVAAVQDIEEARGLLQAANVDAAIIAKIERAEVVADRDLLDSIIDACEGIMVARGDLGIEVGDAELIGIQKDLISRTRKRDRMVITATQMMESMTQSPVPTRAEVSDVANAVLDGTDAVMLSAETAAGKYPARTVSKMSEICLEAEKFVEGIADSHFLDRTFQSIDQSIAMASLFVALHLKIKAIASFTQSGSTALWISRLNSGVSIYAMTPEDSTRRRMSLYRDVQPIFLPQEQNDREELIRLAEQKLVDAKIVTQGDLIVVTIGEPLGQSGGTNTMKIVEISAKPFGGSEQLRF